MITRHFKKVILLSASILTLFAIHPSKADEATPQKIKLALHLKKGQVMNQSIDLEHTSTQVIEKMPFEVDMVMHFDVRYTVLSAAASYRLQATYKTVRFTMTMGATSVDYDSTQSKTPPSGAESMAALVGQSIFITMAPNGATTKIEGTEKIIDRMMAKTKGSASMKASLRKMMLKSMNDDSPFNKGVMPIFPAYAVGEGGSWKNKGTIHSTTVLDMSNTYKVDAIEDDVVALTVSSTFNSSPTAPSMSAPGMRMKYALKGNQSGDMTVNRKTGWTETADVTQDLSGTITMTPTTGKSKSTSWPIKARTTVSISVTE